MFLFSRTIDGVYQGVEATNFASKSAAKSTPRSGEEEVSLTSLDQTVGGKENCEANPEQTGEGKEKYPSIGTIFSRAFSPLPKNPRRRTPLRFDWQCQPHTYQDPFTLPTPSTFLGTQTNSFVPLQDQTYGPGSSGLHFYGAQTFYDNENLGSISDQCHQPTSHLTSNSDELIDGGNNQAMCSKDLDQQAENVNHNQFVGEEASGHKAQGNIKNNRG